MAALSIIYWLVSPAGDITLIGVGVGTAAGISGIVTVIIMITFMIIKCRKNFIRAHTLSETGVESVPSAVIYEEIATPYNFTQCPAYAAANEVTDSCHHNYEDIEICDLDVPTSHEGDIKIQQCSAYGVTTKKN